jgi:opine dehydrogenase
MTVVAVLGAGAGGSASCAELCLAGHEVRLWTRSDATLAPFREAGGVRYEGQLGEGTARPAVLTTDLALALRGAEVAVACLPATAHPTVFEELAMIPATVPLVLNPGGVGGSLEARETFRRIAAALPPLAELSTLTYVARKFRPDTVTVTGVAERVWGAALPEGDQALARARDLFPAVTPAPDVLFTSLANVNLVLHPPGAVLAAAWVEATGGAFRFYVEGMTPGVARVLEALDRERLAVARALGHDLPPLAEEMAGIGTADRAAAASRDVAGAIRGGAANASIMAPGSLDHRYYREDFGFGLLPFTALARLAAVDAPVATSLLRLAAVVVGDGLEREGRTAERMGMDPARGPRELLRSVGG